jgi:hypothetical protein
MAQRLTLLQNVFDNGVTTHVDIMDTTPAVLSRERAKKPGKMNQARMKEGLFDEDDKNKKICRVCPPVDLMGDPEIKSLTDGKVAAFFNSAPYWPYDHHVLHMYHDDPKIMQKAFHIWSMEQIRPLELYFMLKGAITLGQRFIKNPLKTTDLPRMMFGFNIGPDAGQSLSHIHSQYGFETVLDKMDISRKALDLYFEELAREDLVIQHSKDDSFMLVAPWTPSGQYAVDLYFLKRCEIHQLEEMEIRIFAYFGWQIMQRYVQQGIYNMNIIFISSPLGRDIVPVRARFVPRVNKTAMYEIAGRNVIDTPPTAIAEFMRRSGDWQAEEDLVFGRLSGKTFDPIADYDFAAQKAREEIAAE